MFEKVLQRWRDVETLILDESRLYLFFFHQKIYAITVSLIDGALFDTLVGPNSSRFRSCSHTRPQEEIARTLRKNKAPFGGIQVIEFYRTWSLNSTAFIAASNFW